MVERGQPGHPTAVDKKGVAGQVEVAASGEQVLAEICGCEGSVGTCVRHHRAFAVGPHENDARARRPQRVDGEGALDAVALELGAPGPAEQVVADTSCEHRRVAVVAEPRSRVRCRATAHHLDVCGGSRALTKRSGE